MVSWNTETLLHECPFPDQDSPITMNRTPLNAACTQAACIAMQHPLDDDEKVSLNSETPAMCRL